MHSRRSMWGDLAEWGKVGEVNRGDNVEKVGGSERVTRGKA